MGISIQEFQIAMETYGAKRVSDRLPLSGKERLMPCFNVKGINFFHSGEDYIVYLGKHKIVQQIDIFSEDINTVKGILTLISVLEDNYSKELITMLTNETYRKLFTCKLLQSDNKMPFHRLPFPNMKELRQLLKEYDAVVNPFVNCNIKLLDLTKYLDQIKLSLAFGEDWANLYVSAKASKMSFCNNPNGISYNTNCCNDEEKGTENGTTSIAHYYNNGFDSHPIDEIVSLSYTTGGGIDKHPGDIDMNISLKTGLVWITYYKEKATIVTDEQLYIMITHLKRSLEKTKRIIINNIIDKEKE